MYPRLCADSTYFPGVTSSNENLPPSFVISTRVESRSLSIDIETCVRANGCPLMASTTVPVMRYFDVSCTLALCPEAVCADGAPACCKKHSNTATGPQKAVVHRLILAPG